MRRAVVLQRIPFPGVTRVQWVVVAVAIAVLVTALADSWRTALLAMVASTAVSATKIRFARYVAAGLLLLVAIVAVVGRAPAHDDRPEPARPHGAQAG